MDITGEATLVAGSADGAVRAWDEHGTLLATWSDHPGTNLCLAVTLAGDEVVTCSSESPLRAFTLRGGALRATLCPNYGRPVATALRMLPDGATLLEGEPLIPAYSVRALESGKKLGGWAGTGDYGVSALAVNADGKRVVLATDGGMVFPLLPWQKVSGREDEEFRTRHRGGIAAIATTAAGNELLTLGRQDGEVRLWDLKPTAQMYSRPLLHTFGGSPWLARSMALAPSDEELFIGGSDGAIHVFSRTRRELLATWSGHEGAVNALAVSRDGRWLASGGEDGTARVWALPSGTLVQELG